MSIKKKSSYLQEFKPEDISDKSIVRRFVSDWIIKEEYIGIQDKLRDDYSNLKVEYTSHPRGSLFKIRYTKIDSLLLYLTAFIC